MNFLAMLLLVAAGAVADSADDVVVKNEALAALRLGDPALAGAKARLLVARDAANAEYYGILGDACVADGKLTEALDAYEKSSRLRNNRDAGALKKLVEVQVWMRQYSSARKSINSALALSPDDGEAQSSLGSINRRRSLHLIGSAGGWEVDYARNVQEYSAFVGWADEADVYGGVARTDRVFYRRTNVWADAYFFSDYRTYIRLGGRYTRYEYPRSINPNPDATAYDHAVHVQIEGGYAYGAENSIALEFEYFRPNFLWNRDLFANNFKVGASIRNSIAGPVYGRLFAAVLCDPDPLTVLRDPAAGAVTSFRYETLGLLGAGLGYDDGNLSGEVRYVPDRDLDRSLKWSLFARLGYRFERYGVQADLLYDRYPATVARGFTGSRVAMVTILAEPWDFVELRGGVKSLTRLATEVAPFLLLRLKTGI